MLIGAFQSIIIQEGGEHGYLEHELEIPDGELFASYDWRGLIIARIASTAKGLAESYALPLSCWHFLPEPVIRERLSLPESFPMSEI
jgi:hypothetical protein